MFRIEPPRRPAAAALALLLALTWPATAKEPAAAAPAFSIPGGVFTNHPTVALTATPPGAAVRYTLDGSEPGAASPIYTRPLAITNSLILRARVLAKDAPPGPVRSQSYVLLADDLLDFNSNLPLVIINTFGPEIPHEEKAAVSTRFIDPRNGHATPLGAADFDGRAHLNIRGRASLRYPKRSYTVKILAENDDAAKAPILGLAPESDWILYAPFPDKTLLRDVLAYEMSNQLGRWAPRTRFVEVFVNESGAKLSRRDYVGVYVFEEKVKRDLNRVPLKKLDPADHAEPEITGGYLFKKDHTARGDMGPVTLGGFPSYQGAITNNRVGFPTGPGGFPGDPAGFLPPYKIPVRTNKLIVFDGVPGLSTGVRPVREWPGPLVTNHLGGAARRGPSPPRPAPGPDNEEALPPGEPVREFLRTARTNQFFFVDPEPDEITGVQRGWLQHHLNRTEAALHGDDFTDPAKGYAAFLDADSFIDYHLLAEVTKNADAFRFSTFFHKDRGGKIKMGPLWDWNLSFGNCNGKQAWQPEYWLWPQLNDTEYVWFRRLFDDRDFAQKYVDRWTELRGTVFSTTNLLARVDQIAAELRGPQARNFQRWPILGLNVNPNYFVGETYEEELQWMKNWTAARLAWIDQQFVAPPVAAKAGDGQIALTAAAGAIYYTLNGTDPRAPGGGVAPKALTYEGPIKLNDRLTARVLQQTNRWSGPIMLGK